LIQKRDEGCAILLVSTELDEVMQLSDRIAVVYRGKILDVLDAKNATKELVGLLMAGIIPSDEEKQKLLSKKNQILMT
jgi:simple sugar transport system ATP-binding protein